MLPRRRRHRAAAAVRRRHHRTAAAGATATRCRSRFGFTMGRPNLGLR